MIRGTYAAVGSTLSEALGVAVGVTMGTSRFVPPLLLGHRERTILDAADPEFLGREYVGGEACLVVETRFWEKPAEILISEARDVIRVFRQRASDGARSATEGAYRMVVTYDAEIVDP